MRSSGDTLTDSTPNDEQRRKIAEVHEHDVQSQAVDMFADVWCRGGLHSSQIAYATVSFFQFCRAPFERYATLARSCWLCLFPFTMCCALAVSSGLAFERESRLVSVFFCPIQLAVLSLAVVPRIVNS